MVSGIGSASSGNNFFLGSSARSGVFSVSNDDPRNLLQLDPVFQPPSTELREAEEQRAKDSPFLDSDRSSQSSGTESEKSNSISNESLSIAAEPQLGKSISRLAVDNTSEGGSDLAADGQLTFSSGEQEITVNEGDDARIIRNENGSITIENQTTEASKTFESGERLSIEGEGEASVSGFQVNRFESGNNTATRQTSSQLTFSAGEEIQVTDNRGEALRRPGSAEAISIGADDPTAIAIAGGSGEEFLFTSDSGRNISFEAGQTGSISRNDDGTVTVTNDDTGVSETFSSEEGLSTGGEATARLRSSSGDRLDFAGQDQGRFQTGEEGDLELANRATEESIGIEPVTEPPQPERPLQLQTFNNPEAELQQSLQEELIRRPDEEARQRAEAAEEEAQTEEETEESEEPEIVDEAEEEAPQPASFSEEEPPLVVNEPEEETNTFPPIGPEEEEDPFGPVEETEENEEEEPALAVASAENPEEPEEEQRDSLFAPGATSNQGTTNSGVTFTEPGQAINFRA